MLLQSHEPLMHGTNDRLQRTHQLHDLQAVALAHQSFLHGM